MPVLRESSNWTAEMLVLQVALVRTGEGRYDDGIEALESFLTDEVGIAKGQFALDDVCGLSPENLLSPRAVVSLLRFVWSAPWRDAFVAALAVPGTGTLVGWPLLPPVAAKTGTLKHTLALAGVLDAGGAAAPIGAPLPSRSCSRSSSITTCATAARSGARSPSCCASGKSAAGAVTDGVARDSACRSDDGDLRRS